MSRRIGKDDQRWGASGIPGRYHQISAGELRAVLVLFA